MTLPLEETLRIKFFEARALLLQSEVAISEEEKIAKREEARALYHDLVTDLCAFEVFPEDIGTTVSELTWLKRSIDGGRLLSMKEILSEFADD